MVEIIKHFFSQTAFLLKLGGVHLAFFERVKLRGSVALATCAAFPAPLPAWVCKRKPQLWFLKPFVPGAIIKQWDWLSCVGCGIRLSYFIAVPRTRRRTPFPADSSAEAQAWGF